MKLLSTGLVFCVALTSLVAACSDDEIDSDEAARRAYLGLDGSIGKSITLGFQGFNAASSANIPAQMTTGTAPDGTGTLSVSGMVDQGASTNKTMRLWIAMVDYSDGPFVIDEDDNTIVVTYDTAAEQTAQPYLQMKLSNVPVGTIEGSLTGLYTLSGDDLSGEITLDLTFNGMTQGTSQQDVSRVPGSTTVTGTATNSDGGVYDVNVTL